jgi:hypothetical protein
MQPVAHGGSLRDYSFLALTDRYYREQLFRPLCHPTFYVPPPVLQVVLETESLVVVVFVVAASQPEVVSVAASQPEVVSVAASQPEVVSAAHVAGPQASDDIPVPFGVLVPVSVVVVEVDSSGRPKFLAFPNVDCCASFASSVETVREEFFHNPTGAHTSYGLCSILSNLGLHQNRNSGHYHNNPNPGHNNGSDTNHLPNDATTNHSRKTCPHLYREQRRHRPCQVTLSHLVVRQIRWVVVEKY